MCEETGFGRHERQTPSALLLIGPTGSGKTPLGDALERRGLAGRRVVHFDFGANLRRIVERGQPDELVSATDLAFLRDVLVTGALLEDEHFALAQRILRAFLADRLVNEQTIVILNGIPRHVGQARAMGGILSVRVVVRLVCSPETVLARIAGDPGGDRAARVDDDLAAVRGKLAIFQQRTAPLADFYRDQGARIIYLDVTADMTCETAWDALNGRI
jgi:adenylate kinase family enzyme